MLVEPTFPAQDGAEHGLLIVRSCSIISIYYFYFNLIIYRETCLPWYAFHWWLFLISDEIDSDYEVPVIDETGTDLGCTSSCLSYDGEASGATSSHDI